MAEAVSAPLEEKKKSESEVSALKERLATLEYQEAKLETAMEGTTLKIFLQKLMTRFDKLPPLEQKRAIQAAVPKVQIEEKPNSGYQLHLFVSLDPNRPPQKETLFLPTIRASGGGSAGYKSWGCGASGGPDAYRTRDLHNAIVALSQLSYGPIEQIQGSIRGTCGWQGNANVWE